MFPRAHPLRDWHWKVHIGLPRTLERAWADGAHTLPHAGLRLTGDVLDEACAALAKEGKVVGIAADVSKAEDCARIFATTAKELGRGDVLVNNAGTHQNGPFEAASDEIWQADFDLKLFAAIRLSRAALPKVKERRWGRIVNTLNSGAKWQRFGSAPTPAATSPASRSMSTAACARWCSSSPVLRGRPRESAPSRPPARAYRRTVSIPHHPIMLAGAIDLLGPYSYPFVQCNTIAALQHMSMT